MRSRAALRFDRRRRSSADSRCRCAATAAQFNIRRARPAIAAFPARFAGASRTGSGELIAETTIHHSNDPYFRERLPWRLGLVRLDVGPTAVVHLHGGCGPAPARVRVGARLDKSGQGVLLAFPPR